MTNKKRHYLGLFAVLIGFALVQTLMGVLSDIRDYQYYARIFFLMEINIILTVSLGLINGFTGQFSIGHAGFMAIGAYGSVLITTLLPKAFGVAVLNPATASGQLFFVLAVLAGGAIAALFGLIIGFPSLRLKGDYLAIVTLAGGEVIRALIRYFDFAGGPRGVPGIPMFANAFYIGLFFLISIWIMRNFLFSHYGRGCIAVRDNEIAAGAMGINATFQKVAAFVIGAFFAGIGGALFAHMSQYINPDNFGILKSLDYLIFLYVGGSSTMAGAMVGAALFTLIPEILRSCNIEQWRMVLYPLILILTIRFRLEGIMGSREFGFLIPWNFKSMKQKGGGNATTHRH